MACALALDIGLFASDRWHYDVQMPVEDTRVVGGQTTIVRNIVGPRGIDAQFDGSNAAFALYDTHGNAKALLSRSGSSFTTADWRHYDVWGSVRSGLTSGGASHRYCANLGHVTDDESGLVYMRARFYEPWTGRFISQDPAMDGANWYVYCGNSPTVKTDKDGTVANFINAILTNLDLFCQGGAILGITLLIGSTLMLNWATSPAQLLAAVYMAQKAVAVLSLSMTFSNFGRIQSLVSGGVGAAVGSVLSRTMSAMILDIYLNMAAGARTYANHAVTAAGMYACFLIALLAVPDIE